MIQVRLATKIEIPLHVTSTGPADTPNLINIGHELRNLNAITNVANVNAMAFSDKYLADVTSINSAKVSLFALNVPIWITFQTNLFCFLERRKWHSSYGNCQWTAKNELKHWNYKGQKLTK